LPANYDLDLYDPGGIVVAQSRESWTYPEHIVYTAQQQGEYRLRVSGYGGAYSGMDPYRLRLYDPQCQPVKQSMGAYKGTVRMRHTAAVSGMWYVKVLTALGFSTTEPYSITGSVQAWARDRLEDNDDVRLRTMLDRPLTEHVEQNLRICPADEQDWFAVRMEVGDNLLASLTHSIPSPG
jgi:hypothetical protein